MVMLVFPIRLLAQDSSSTKKKPCETCPFMCYMCVSKLSWNQVYLRATNYALCLLLWLFLLVLLNGWYRFVNLFEFNLFTCMRDVRQILQSLHSANMLYMHMYEQNEQEKKKNSVPVSLYSTSSPWFLFCFCYFCTRMRNT